MAGESQATQWTATHQQPISNPSATHRLPIGYPSATHRLPVGNRPPSAKSAAFAKSRASFVTSALPTLLPTPSDARPFHDVEWLADAFWFAAFAIAYSLPCALSLLLPAAASAQAAGIPPSTRQTFPADRAASVPQLAAAVRNTTSELAEAVSRYIADAASINRHYDLPNAPSQRSPLRGLYATWRSRLTEFDLNKLLQEGKVDYVLLTTTCAISSR